MRNVVRFPFAYGMAHICVCIPMKIRSCQRPRGDTQGSSKHSNVSFDSKYLRSVTRQPGYPFTLAVINYRGRPHVYGGL